jgi:hypothetical protein
MWIDKYIDEPVLKERGWQKWDYKSELGTAWIESDGDKHIVQWLRGRGKDCQKSANLPIKAQKPNPVKFIRLARRFPVDSLSRFCFNRGRLDRKY